MPPSRYWPRLSMGAILCARIFPEHGSSLPHVSRLIDEYVIQSFDERVLRAACELGAPLSDLEYILSRTTPNWAEVVRAAAKGGYLHVFRWMTERQDSCGPWKADFYIAVDEAARCGQQEIIQWLHERGLGSIHGYAMAEAIAHGHLPVVKWLLHEGAQLKDFDRRQLRLAAENGHLQTVQWIHENFKDVATSYAMEGVATTGDLEMLQWLHHQNRCSKAGFSLVMNAAVSGGHFHVVEWLFENYSQSCPGYAAERAAKAGNLPMLQ